MNIKEITEIVERINKKKEKVSSLERAKTVIDSITKNEVVEVNINKTKKGDVVFTVDAVELVRLIDKEIAKQDTTADETELKAKAK